MQKQLFIITESPIGKQNSSPQALPKKSIYRDQCFFFAKVYILTITFWFPKCTLFGPLLHNSIACSLRSLEKTPKNFPRALFLHQFRRKTPFCGFWSDDMRIKKLFLVSFPLPVCCRRAQRAEICDLSAATVSRRSNGS